MTANFEDVVEAHSAELVRYAMALAGDRHQALDIVQEVLTRAYTKWSRVGATADPKAYLIRMVTNEFLSWRRRWSTRSIRTYADGALGAAAGAVADHSDGVVARHELEARLAALPRRQQAALVLHYLEGRDYDDCAAILGCPASTVRSACARGLAALRIDYRNDTHEPTEARWTTN